MTKITAAIDERIEQIDRLNTEALYYMSSLALVEWARVEGQLAMLVHEVRMIKTFDPALI